MDQVFLDALDHDTEALRGSGLYKDERIIDSPQAAEISLADGARVINFCANNYLGLSNHPALVEAARAGGFETFIDLCAVDHLAREPRFDVVVNLLSTQHTRRLLIKVGVPNEDPSLPSISMVYPGANFYERETWDMFGIVFDGHPDLTRLLMPDEWDGHPLRKDYRIGSVPVEFKATR
ncbi:MAG: NADH-quinone oxidoreductase subunit C [Acidobacteria bacterium]|nr:NADH-quinone oxidoreductase subunit C [Acidobacteriota bacterium]